MNLLEVAIVEFTKDRSFDAIRQLYQAFMSADLLVPVSKPVEQIRSGLVNIPATCIREISGEGVLPTFTSEIHLLEWKRAGHLYVMLSGQKIVEMAVGMPEVDAIAVNLAGGPRGRIPRSDYRLMLADC